MSVDAHPLPRRAAEQFVNRYSQRLALDVPQGHVDAAQGAGEYRAASIEGMAVYRLPVMNHLARVFAHEVRLELLHSGRDGRRPPFDDWLSQPDNPGIGVNLQEQPSRLDEQGFQLRDPKRILGGDRSVARDAVLGLRLGSVERGQAQTSKEAATTWRRLIRPEASFGVFIVINSSILDRKNRVRSAAIQSRIEYPRTIVRPAKGAPRFVPIFRASRTRVKQVSQAAAATKVGEMSARLDLRR